MVTTTLLSQLKGPFSFLSRDPAEILRLVPDAERSLPVPQQIFLEDEAATPLVGFPVLLSAELRELEAALEEYLRFEEGVQLAVLARQPFDPNAYAAAWERYRALLARATENTTGSSYGRRFPAIFWLHHSLAVARVLRDTPRRVMRESASLGREHGERIRYQVLDKFLDRAVKVTYDIVDRLAAETEEVEEELFPALFTRLRDNVLIFTEDHVGPQLGELSGYFAGQLHIDGRAFRDRLAETAAWLGRELRGDAALRGTARLLGGNSEGDPRDLLLIRGLTSILALRPAYDPQRLLTHEQVRVWERLLVKLKEFELFHALRRLVVGVEKDAAGLVARDRSLGRFGIGPQTARISPSTRPLDFLAPWVVDPQVSRFGMIYDISDFTETISTLRRSGAAVQDRSFRQLFLFQRRIHRLARQHRSKMEKYLGDGAFFSAREASPMLALAIQVQRLYAKAVGEGFSFARGLRIALNYGQYRLLPVQAGRPGDLERYEFFGHGVVELSRLTTGKAAKEVDELKTFLVAHGYPEGTVNRFFAPLTAHGLDLVDRIEEEREFFAYLTRTGSLVNEGIVATGGFIEHLDREETTRRLFAARDGQRSYVALHLPGPAGSLLVGLRKLGNASLKGLDRLPVYEVVDGAAWTDTTLVELRGGRLVELLERDFIQRRTGAPFG
ncbi:MAG: hypothetical protein KJ058_13430 [Thermoanaerobaculia bacterium]|nr:hypothetical protein [Thermoanaerobaculia bacterium]MCZ7650915.1 hypothetical protein [Thermoanaerobaculia bacterium]